MQGNAYAVDLVLCVDATGSMAPIIDVVKEKALSFHQDLQQVMNEKHKRVSELRIRVIGFRDYYFDGDLAMESSEFFKLPEQREQFSEFVRGLVAYGGGDEPENGLEALALAMASDWNDSPGKRRQVIVMWTDASAHKLELHSGDKPETYPPNLPRDFSSLTDLWETAVDRNARRLLVYAPDAYAWTDISNNWLYTAKRGARPLMRAVG